MSTEIYFGVTGAHGSKGVDVESQFNWMAADLKKANANRKNVPWLVVHGHRAIYCSCDGDCDASAGELREGVKQKDGSLKYGLEELFMQQGVDFFFNGHEHNYERNWPTYRNKTEQSNVDPKAPIYIVTGAAGCRELHEPFSRKQPARSAFRSNNFGYSRFIIHNSSHVHWQQVIMDPMAPKSGKPWFVQRPDPGCTDPDPDKSDPPQCSGAR